MSIESLNAVADGLIGLFVFAGFVVLVHVVLADKTKIKNKIKSKNEKDWWDEESDSR